MECVTSPDQHLIKGAGGHAASTDEAIERLHVRTLKVLRGPVALLAGPSMTEFTKTAIVVGAGVSGLACARRLIDVYGYSVRILEARDRVGGRVLTTEHEGVRVDIGRPMSGARGQGPPPIRSSMSPLIRRILASRHEEQ
jgi:monoamine oxidase